MDSEEEMGLEMSIISIIIEEIKNHWSIPQGSIPVEMSGCELCFIFISSKDILLFLSLYNLQIISECIHSFLCYLFWLHFIP